MQHKKIIASLGFLICLSTNLSGVAYADNAVPFVDEGISIAYEIAGNPISSLDITNKIATCTSRVDGAGAISITVTQTLQKYWGLWVWNDVEGAKWTRSVDQNSIRLSNTKQNLDKGTYRVKSVFVLTDKDGQSETITIYSNEQKIS